MSDVFYLSLPSTASSRIYPDNSPGKFKVKLAKEIYLPESEFVEHFISVYIGYGDSQECQFSEVSGSGFLMQYGT